jgi:DNA polymerase-3 subunit delta
MSPRQAEMQPDALFPPLAAWLRFGYTFGMAKKALHAVDYLAKSQKHPPKPVCVLFGDEPFLKRQALCRLRDTVLGDDESEFSFFAFDGRKALLSEVLDELGTVAMFGSGNRLAVVEDADKFVTKYRSELEDYVARPAKSVLVLEVKTFPANTRLHKAVAAEGLPLDCSSPPPARLGKWMTGWAKTAYEAELTTAAAELLLETIGPEMGLLDQELAKLAPSAADGKITPEMVEKLVGGWRTKTTWDMLDEALLGNTAAAMLQLDRLLASGESPVGLLGQISASLRRFAAATRLIIQNEAAGRRVVLRSALEQAGIRSFVLKKAEGQLRQLGRNRGKQMYGWLLQADLDLKGFSALPPRAILERLIVRISAPAAK